MTSEPITELRLVERRMNVTASKLTLVNSHLLEVESGTTINGGNENWHEIEGLPNTSTRQPS